MIKIKQLTTDQKLDLIELTQRELIIYFDKDVRTNTHKITLISKQIGLNFTN